MELFFTIFAAYFVISLVFLGAYFVVRDEPFDPVAIKLAFCWPWIGLRLIVECAAESRACFALILASLCVVAALAFAACATSTQIRYEGNGRTIAIDRTMEVGR